MITHVAGNAITLAKENGGCIVHQTNSIPVAGAGIALGISIRFPSWKREYMLSGGGDELLGRCWLFRPEEDRNVTIASLYAQSSVSRDSKVRNTNYEYLARALENLSLQTQIIGEMLYVPFGIGCGYGGGSWKIVYAMIGHYLSRHYVTIVKLEE